MTDELLKCQRQFMYLRNIFIGSADIQKALPEEHRKFMLVNKKFTGFMQKLSKQNNPVRYLQASTNRNAIADLKTYNNLLEECNNGLENYMAEKRRDFPRFFFLSNDELIDILANSQDIERIQLHLKTLFDNLVRMHVEGDSIKEIISGEKEHVKLK
jgi:dynein heavy chain